MIGFYLLNVCNRNLSWFESSFCSVVGGACAYVASDANFGLSFFTSGQRIVPGRCDTPLVWKPYLNSIINLTYVDWHPNEPSCPASAVGTDVEDCLHLWSFVDYQWSDCRCSGRGCAICQIDILWRTKTWFGTYTAVANLEDKKYTARWSSNRKRIIKFHQICLCSFSEYIEIQLIY